MDDTVSSNLSIEDIIRPIKKAPKIRSDHDIDMIQEATRLIPFFARYISEGRPDVHLKCCKYMTYETFQDGETVFSQGERGSKFYIILEGRVGVFLNNRSEAKRVKHMQRGESFGELALVNDEPRSASIKCERSCHFAVLEKKYYINLFKQILEEEIKSNVSFYSQIELFSDWNYNKIKAFYNHSFRIQVKKGERIINEGDPIDAVYIITSGEFMVMKHKTKLDGKGSINEELKRHQTKRMSTITQHFEQMKLFILISYEIFGQEYVEEEDETAQTFSYSVDCNSFEGSLIHIKLQDYQKVILQEERQREYIRQYSKSRLQRLTVRQMDVSNWLSTQQEKQSVIQLHTDSEAQSGSNPKINNLLLLPPPPSYQNFRSPKKSLSHIPMSENRPSQTQIIDEVFLHPLATGGAVSSKTNLFTTNTLRIVPPISEQQLQVDPYKNATKLESSHCGSFSYLPNIEHSNTTTPSRLLEELPIPLSSVKIQVKRPETEKLVTQTTTYKSESLKTSPKVPKTQDNWFEYDDIIPLHSSSTLQHQSRQTSQRSLSQPQKIPRKSPLSPMPAEVLHPLVQGFHEQLKIRFYSKFKNGQIGDLKQHLSSFMPIASMQIGGDLIRGSGSHQNSFGDSIGPFIQPMSVNKNKQELRIKEIRAYEARLRMLIKSEVKVSPESLSPSRNNQTLFQSSSSNIFKLKPKQLQSKPESVQNRLQTFLSPSPVIESRKFSVATRPLTEQSKHMKSASLIHAQEFIPIASPYKTYKRSITKTSKSLSSLDPVLGVTTSLASLLTQPKYSLLNKNLSLSTIQTSTTETRTSAAPVSLGNALSMIDKVRRRETKRISLSCLTPQSHPGFRGQKGFNCSLFNFSKDRGSLAISKH